MSRYRITLIAILTLALLGSAVSLAAASPASPGVSDDLSIVEGGHLQPIDPPPGIPVEFEGTVASVNITDGTGAIEVNTVTGATITVEITTDTTIEPAEVEVDVQVEIEGWWTAPHPVVVADEVEVLDDTGDGEICFEFYGRLNAIAEAEGGSTWTIGNRDVFVSSDMAAAVSAEAGVMVKVKVCVEGETLVAQEVEVLDSPGHRHRRVVRGLITDIAGDIVTLNDGEWVIQLAENYTLLPPHITDLNVGDRIVAQGRVPETSTETEQEPNFVAERVIVLGAGGPGDGEGSEPVIIEGQVDAVSDTSLTIAGIVMTRTASTMVLPPIRDLDKGAWVIVHATVERADDGTFAGYTALRIVIKPFGGEADEIRFVGNFESANGETWVISGLSVKVPDDLEVSAPEAAGTRVGIRATYNSATGTYTATEVWIGGEGGS